MERFVHSGTRSAAFREGRALCIRLVGPLDSGLSAAVRRFLRSSPDVVRLRLECSTLGRIEADGARHLAGTLQEWGRSGGRSIELLNLDPGLRRQLAWHPLGRFCDGAPADDARRRRT